MRAVGFVRGVLLAGMVFAALSVAGVAAADDTPTAHAIPFTGFGPNLSPPIVDAILAIAPDPAPPTPEYSAAEAVPSQVVGRPWADAGHALDMMLPAGPSPIGPILSLLETFGFALPHQAQPDQPMPWSDPTGPSSGVDPGEMPAESRPADSAGSGGPAESTGGVDPAESAIGAESAVVGTGEMFGGGSVEAWTLARVGAAFQLHCRRVLFGPVDFAATDFAATDLGQAGLRETLAEVGPQVSGVPPRGSDRGDPVEVVVGARVGPAVIKDGRADSRHRYYVSRDGNGHTMIGHREIPRAHPGPGYLGGARAGPGPPAGSERVEPTAAVEPAAVVSTTVDTIGAAPAI
ncbi:hypothetical protein [Nocardia sp. MW-W600-9]